MNRWLWLMIGMMGLLVGCDDDGRSDADADTDTDSDTGSESETDSDTDTDTETESETDSDTQVDCSDRPGEATPARADHATVLDEARHRLVVFGGDTNPPINCIPSPEYDGSTWAYELDCDNWRRIDAEGPSPRARMANALDSQRGQMVIFGGRYRAGNSGPYTHYDDTWAFDLASETWTEIEAPGGPSARVNGSMVYDRERDRMILFGGNTSTNGLVFTPRDDTWALDLQTHEWTEIAEEGPPRARLFHAATVTPDGTRMIVFSGGDENAYVGPFMRDAWSLGLATGQWTELGRPDPDARISSMLIGLPTGSALILFGGHDDGALGNRNDLWLVDVSDDDLDWTLLIDGDELDEGGNGFCDFPEDFATIDPNSPERRSSAGFSASADGTHVYLFGGKTDCGLVNDVWDLDVAEGAWTERFPSTGGAGLACLRSGRANCSSMCF